MLVSSAGAQIAKYDQLNIGPMYARILQNIVTSMQILQLVFEILHCSAHTDKNIYDMLWSQALLEVISPWSFPARNCIQ